ncbi:MAG: class I SAM-dependent methyltransferase [Acidobacteriota bacterium]
MTSKSIRRRLYEALWSDRVRAVLGRVRFVRRIYIGWIRTHPYDDANGVETRSTLAARRGTSHDAGGERALPYGGSQPSIVRTALASLPDRERYAFVDLGCGKGRPLIVASEFSFSHLLGVELSPDLASVARRNAAIVAARHPERTPIAIQIGDATAVTAPTDRVAFFMYHPFDRDLVADLIRNLERQLAGGLRHAFLLYYNPVHGEVVDLSPHFERWSAATLPYADDELGFGPDLSDTLVIWQSRPPLYPARRDAERSIVVHASGTSAGLASIRSLHAPA